MHGIDTTFLIQAELREAPGHSAAKAWLSRQLEGGGTKPTLAVAPQIITEFIHVVTDPRRFEQPLTMDEALDHAEFWWEAKEVKTVFPSTDTTRLALHWLRQHRLGRKRLLDTELAATYFANDVRSLLTLNRTDFEVFDVFKFPEY